ncbi:MAG: hypothetical protein HZA67_02290 [Rhodospirillales bacterium]|nr:hypothetical protein [Rhodospirillales bacterium]
MTSAREKEGQEPLHEDGIHAAICQPGEPVGMIATEQESSAMHIRKITTTPAANVSNVDPTQAIWDQLHAKGIYSLDEIPSRPAGRDDVGEWRLSWMGYVGDSYARLKEIETAWEKSQNEPGLA